MSANHITDEYVKDPMVGRPNFGQFAPVVFINLHLSMTKTKASDDIPILCRLCPWSHVSLTVRSRIGRVWEVFLITELEWTLVSNAILGRQRQVKVHSTLDIKNACFENFSTNFPEAQIFNLSRVWIRRASTATILCCFCKDHPLQQRKQAHDGDILFTNKHTIKHQQHVTLEWNERNFWNISSRI